MAQMLPMSMGGWEITTLPKLPCKKLERFGPLTHKVWAHQHWVRPNKSKCCPHYWVYCYWRESRVVRWVDQFIYSEGRSSRSERREQCVGGSEGGHWNGKSIEKLATDSEIVCGWVPRHSNPGGKEIFPYFRFNIQWNIGDIGLGDWTKFGELTEHTYNYLNEY